MSITQDDLRRLEDMKSHLSNYDRGAAESLINQFTARRKLTIKQWEYAGLLLSRAQNQFQSLTEVKQPSPDNDPPYLTGFKELYNIFLKVREEKHIAEPKIFFEVEGNDRFKFRLMLASVGRGVTVTCREKDRDRADRFQSIYLGAVKPSGDFVYRQSIHQFGLDKIKAELVAFQANPSEYGKLHGKRFRYCCFCGIELTSEDSLFYGYGPICADNFGLEWGYAKERIREQAANEIAATLAGIDFAALAGQAFGQGVESNECTTETENLHKEGEDHRPVERNDSHLWSDLWKNRT